MRTGKSAVLTSFTEGSRASAGRIGTGLVHGRAHGVERGFGIETGFEFERHGGMAFACLRAHLAQAGNGAQFGFERHQEQTLAILRRDAVEARW